MAPDDWKLHLAVVVDGEAVGVQDAFAKRFGVTRSFETGSWLGRDFQGRGIGTEMRAAVLHLGFAGLGARESHSGCWSDNPASAGVSRKLGYVDNGWETLDREGVPARMTKLLLTRDAWAPDRRDDIVIEGLDPCREMLGI
jgi:RimJ/RimL family protein N-acetyltransferase